MYILKNAKLYREKRNKEFTGAWNHKQHIFKLESSQSPHTSAKAMLFARWQHHHRFCSNFPYAPLKEMVTKILKWSRIHDSFWITPKIETLVVCAIPDTTSKFQKNPSITFWVILLTHRQTDRQTDKPTKSGKNITSLAEITKACHVRSSFRSQTLMVTDYREHRRTLLTVWYTNVQHTCWSADVHSQHKQYMN